MFIFLKFFQTNTDLYVVLLFNEELSADKIAFHFSFLKQKTFVLCLVAVKIRDKKPENNIIIWPLLWVFFIPHVAYET